jgi:hypothetical protein
VDRCTATTIRRSATTTPTHSPQRDLVDFSGGDHEHAVTRLKDGCQYYNSDLAHLRRRARRALEIVFGLGPATEMAVTDYEIVVSADNNAWLEWQAMVFHYSCVRRLGYAPIIVVHGEGELRDGYRMIEATGGTIQRAPGFRRVAGDDYPPRNTAGTLACVETHAAHLVLCDPDMIFVRDERFGSLRLGRDEISVDRSSFLRVNYENREHLALACARAGVSLKTLDDHPIDGGVPVVVPTELRENLAREWLACIDLILGLPRTESFVRALHWLTSMWGLVLSVSRLGLRASTTAFAVGNVPGAPPVPEDPRQGPALIHYCYGDEVFDKREFHGPPEVCERVWWVERVGGWSLGARIREEVCAAREFYGLRVGT